MQYYIGTSGWHYEDWQGRFYPQELPKTKWLEFYSSHFCTVEINNSFYRLPSERAFGQWRQATGESFSFAVKVSRFITHVKRLKDAGEALALFISRARFLGTKLGPLLYQLPPNLPRDDERLRSFLSLLPKGLKHVFEFRNESWFKPEVLSLLREYGAGFCSFDMPSLACPLEATASFAYIRFHGSGSLYSSNYSDEELSRWAERIAGLPADLKEVYIYFNNDAQAFAVRNALTLGRFLGQAGSC